MVQLQISRIDNVTVIEAVGRLVSPAEAALQETLFDEIERGNANLVLDLSGVDFIDEAGLRALLQVYKRAREMAGSLRLAQPSQPVHAVLRDTGPASIFYTYATKSEAVGSY